MKTVPNRLYLLLLLPGLVVTAPALAASESSPDFEEVRQLVREHLAGTSDSELNRASVEGLLNSLRGKVRLIATNAPPATNAPAITKVTMIDDQIACLRVGQVSASLPAVIRRQCISLAATNKLIGLVLDLRFARGEDYAAAAATADLFVPTQRPLLDWGKGPIKSAEKDDAFTWPVAVLVNTETIGAAEALAAVLRETGVALILGGTTRGAAMTTEDFPLKNGQQLRIATAPVKLGTGETLSKGVKPDIEVKISPELERAFLDDPYVTTTRTNLASGPTGSTSSAATNRPTRRRPNEADLVRARRDGFSLDGEFPVGADTEPEKPALRDPTLARAVDLLKGLAVVRRARP
jgi:C-terminal processing protease CtpA/Prc